MKKITLPVIIEQNEEGYFAYCPSLQGCYTQADSYEEIIVNIKDAISLHIEDRITNGEELPNIGQISLTSVEVMAS
jgi:predicted RNase H-like HicB family nuclease